MRNIDKTRLPGKVKARMYQRGLLPKKAWLLMLYEITLTAVEKLLRNINKHVREWLGVTLNITRIRVYSKTTK